MWRKIELYSWDTSLFRSDIFVVVTVSAFSRAVRESAVRVWTECEDSERTATRRRANESDTRDHNDCKRLASDSN